MTSSSLLDLKAGVSYSGTLFHETWLVALHRGGSPFTRLPHCHLANQIARPSHNHQHLTCSIRKVVHLSYKEGGHLPIQGRWYTCHIRKVDFLPPSVLGGISILSDPVRITPAHVPGSPFSRTVSCDAKPVRDQCVTGV